MARDFNGGFEIAVYVRTVDVRRVVEREGVIKSPPALSRNASVHAATFSHFSHLCHGEPGSGWVGCRRGVETAPGPGLSAQGRRAPGPAWPRPAASADAPACGQAVGAKLARMSRVLGRGRWTRGARDGMNGKTEGLSDCNTCFTYEGGAGVKQKRFFPGTGIGGNQFEINRASINRGLAFGFRVGPH